MIQKSLLFSVLAICIAGCSTNNPNISTFEDLHRQVKHTLGPDFECGPIVSSSMPYSDKVATNWSFEVKSPHSPIPVEIAMRKFVTKNEWRRHFKDGTNAWAKLLDSATGTNSAKSLSSLTNQPHFLNQVTNFFTAMELPNWYYKNIGVDVSFSAPEVVYPGVDEEIKAAQDTLNKVVDCLEPYQN